MGIIAGYPGNKAYMFSISTDTQVKFGTHQRVIAGNTDVYLVSLTSLCFKNRFAILFVLFYPPYDDDIAIRTITLIKKPSLLKSFRTTATTKLTLLVWIFRSFSLATTQDNPNWGIIVHSQLNYLTTGITAKCLINTLEIKVTVVRFTLVQWIVHANSTGIHYHTPFSKYSLRFKPCHS